MTPGFTPRLQSVTQSYTVRAALRHRAALPDSCTAAAAVVTNADGHALGFITAINVSVCDG